MIRAFSFTIVLGLYAAVLIGLAFVPEDIATISAHAEPDEVALLE